MILDLQSHVSLDKKTTMQFVTNNRNSQTQVNHTSRLVGVSVLSAVVSWYCTALLTAFVRLFYYSYAR